jgi:hypothetical protein
MISSEDGVTVMREEATSKVGSRLRSKAFAEFFRGQPETGMGYWVTDVVLKDGSRVSQVVVDSGYITKIKSMLFIPFDEDDIDHFVVTHEKWNWRTES